MYLNQHNNKDLNIFWDIIDRALLDEDFTIIVL